MGWVRAIPLWKRRRACFHDENDARSDVHRAIANGSCTCRAGGNYLAYAQAFAEAPQHGDKAGQSRSTFEASCRIMQTGCCARRAGAAQQVAALRGVVAAVEAPFEDPYVVLGLRQQLVERRVVFAAAPSARARRACFGRHDFSISDLDIARAIPAWQQGDGGGPAARGKAARPVVGERAQEAAVAAARCRAFAVMTLYRSRTACGFSDAGARHAGAPRAQNVPLSSPPAGARRPCRGRGRSDILQAARDVPPVPGQALQHSAHVRDHARGNAAVCACGRKSDRDRYPASSRDANRPAPSSEQTVVR